MSNRKKILFTEKDIKEYLDKCIRYWRKKKIKADKETWNMACHYIDAFQSIRISLFDNALPIDKD